MRTTRHRIFQPPTGSFFLFGPRGTGKTLWTRSAFPGALMVDLLDPVEARTMAARPERLRERLAAATAVTNVVIDEVQKMPVLLEMVHQMIASGSPYRFILTGSSARKLRRGEVNLLGGRAIRCVMHPYVASELGSDFELDRALRIGMIPVVVESDDPEQTLRSYVALYIYEEVLSEGLSRNAEQFARFLEAISFSHAQVLNVSNVARDCGVKRKTVEHSIEILEDLMLGSRLPVFTHHAKREVVSHPKFYFFDTGVYRALRPFGPLDDRTAIDGHALEGLVAQHLRAYCDYAADGRRLYYWRTRTNVEVDFVVYGPETFMAIEVKNVNEVRPADVRGLRSFLELYPQAQATLLYRGAERLKMHGIMIEPLTPWLQALV
ncbi:MAG: ATP-binding protein [Candidatus Kapabacteria bacterium]|nr:ATP-binding protein [Candidatus Kapabacteria bacterium]